MGCGGERAQPPELEPSKPALVSVPELTRDQPLSVDPTLIPDPPPFPRLNVEADLQRGWLLAEGPHKSATDGRRLVTLTFDDGPGPRTTDAVLKVLRDHHATATFFMVGQYFQGPSKRAAKVRKAAVNVAAEGHLIGNHTMHHRRLRGLGDARTRAEIETSANLIEKVTGRAPHVFRPPFGDIDSDAQAVLAAESQELVLWTVEAKDMLRTDADAMLHDLKNQLDYSQGGIVLLHDVKWSTVKVLDKLLRYLENAKYDPAHPERVGYEIVDLPTYMRATAAAPQPYASRDELNHVRTEQWKVHHADKKLPKSLLERATFRE